MVMNVHQRVKCTILNFQASLLSLYLTRLYGKKEWELQNFWSLFQELQAYNSNTFDNQKYSMENYIIKDTAISNFL